MKMIVALIAAALLLAPTIAPAAERSGVKELSSAGAQKSSAPKLDLNRASLDELIAVPGIGPRTAQAIIDLRAKKGSFAGLDDLLEVTGIKQKKLASLAGYLEVVPAKIPAGTTAPTSANR